MTRPSPRDVAAARRLLAEDRKAKREERGPKLAKTDTGKADRGRVRDNPYLAYLRRQPCGLWTEVARLAGELRPRGLLLENSSNLLSINGGADFGRVLGDLAALGYDAEWHCLPAAAFDAPHIRDRLWIVAQRQVASSHLASIGRQPCRPEPAGQPRRPVSDGHDTSPNAHGLAPVGTAIARAERVSWEPEPDVVRVVHGASNRVERVHALGNLNPPIIPELLGRAILAAEAQREAA